MSVDPRKLKDKAAVYLREGRFARAAEAYSEYCSADPKDLQARLRMGDAWAKAGQRDKAVLAYQFAAEGFAQSGFLPRAIAASKLILELDPAHQGVQKMLADLYARKSGPQSGAGARARPLATLAGPAKHAPIDLPEVGDAPLEIEESASFRTRKVEQPRAAPPPPPPMELPVDEAPPLWPKAKRTIAEEAEAMLGEAREFVESAKKGEDSGRIKRTTSGAYEIDLEPPAVVGTPVVEPGAPLPAAAPAPPLEEGVTASGSFIIDTGSIDEPLAVIGTPEVSELQRAEESGRIKRAASGAYELDLDDEPEPAPVELTRPKVAAEREIDEARLVAELEAPASAATEGSAGPPGLEAKRLVPPSPPASRLWLPNNVTSGGSAEESAARRFTAPLRGGPRTDLERSLEAFSQFEADGPGPQAAALPQVDLDRAAIPPPRLSAGRPRTFTELELEGDSLLHAVETAASIGLELRGQPEAPGADEERMEPPEEPRLEPGVLPKIPLFSDLPEAAFIALFERCPLRRYEPTQLVIQQGSLGDSFFVICSGSVKVFRADGEVRRDIATLQEGAFFGEMALLSGAARTASVEAAAEDTQLLEISAPILTELSHKHPTVAAALKKFCRQRLLTNVMSSSALFAPFSRTERRSLVERFRARDVQKGDVLIREGQRSDGMYVVLSGEIEVRLGSQPVASLNEGDIFGEMSLLTKAPATATCAAARRTSLLRLPREDFDAIVLSHPQILVLVSELTDERKRLNAATASRSISALGESTPMV